MAARYWVGGTGSWNGTATGKWATSSGGASGAAEPTAADDVFFDAASGAVTITLAANRPCRSLNCTGFTGTFTMQGSTQLSIGDGTAGAGNIALKFVAGMTFTKNSNTTSIIAFITTSGTQQTIDFGGKEPGALTFDGAGASWLLSANMNANNSSPIVHTRGTLNTGGFSVNCLSFTSSNSNTRALNFTNSSITCNGSTGTFTLANQVGLTLTTTGSTITLNSGNATFNGGGFSFNNLVFNPSGGSITLLNTGTCANVTVGGNSSGRLLLQQDLTVSGVFTTNSSASTNMSFIRSNASGTQRTITAASVSLQNHNFQDIIAAGAAAPWDATNNVGDAGGNSNITFPSPVTRYWVAPGTGTVGQSTNSWNNTANWSTSSGGAGGASIPLCHDTAVFDANSVTASGRLITVNQEVVPPLDFSNVLNSPTVNGTITNGIIYIRGSVTYKAGLTLAGGTIMTFIGRSAHTLTSAGLSIPNPLQVDCFGGSLTLLDNYTSSSLSSAFTHLSGTLDFNDFNVNVPFFNSNGTITRTLSMGNGTITLTATGTVWNTVTSTNLTINQEESTILITDTSATQKTFAGGSRVFNNLTISAGTGGTIFINQNNTFNVLTVGGGRTIAFPANGTTTVTRFVPQGSSGNVVSIISTTGGTRGTISQASGYVWSDYLSITDSTASGGAWFGAGPNSTNGGNNVGWVFNAHLALGNDATHAHTVDSFAIVQHFSLLVADALHAHSVDNVPISVKYTLAVSDATHQHLVDSLALAQKHILAAQDASHAHTVENLVLVQKFLLAIQDALHAHSVDNVSLSQKHYIDVEDAFHDHDVDNVNITSKQYLQVDGTFHGHTVDSVVLSTAFRRVIRVTLEGAPNRVTLDQPDNSAIIELEEP